MGNLCKVGICGYFGFGKTLLNGQTIKTKIIAEELKARFGGKQVSLVDYAGGKKRFVGLIVQIVKLLRKCSNILILPAHNSVRMLAPMLVLFNHVFRRRLHYVVIGGWLPEFLKERMMLSKYLKQFDNIYVETKTMKESLVKQGFNNVVVMPNCKRLHILDKTELVYPKGEPYKLCTFSRVMKEKGIEDAVQAVQKVNARMGRVVYTLDIYGQVDEGQTEWFETLKKSFPDFVQYGGLVSFDKSTEILKVYFALLFPTYYGGEGFAGTLIDAMAAGVPVIASDWKYNEDLVQEGVTGTTYPVKNISALTDKLEHVLTHLDEWFVMKEKCIREATKYLPGTVLEPLIKNLM